MFKVNDNYLKLPGSYLFFYDWKKSSRLQGSESRQRSH